MQSSNIAGASVLQSNGTKSSPDPNHAPWILSLSPGWQSRPDVNSLDQRLSDDFTWSQEFVEEMHHLTDLTGCHSIPENLLAPHLEIPDNGQFYYPSEPQASNPFTTDDSLEQAYVWSHWFDPGFPAMISQLSTKQLPVMASTQSSLGCDYRVCHWIEDDVQCGRIISGGIRHLGTHLRNAHKVQGNEKMVLVCRWRDCGEKLQRRGIRRHIASRHLKIQSYCQRCSKPYSRRDAMKKHARECQGA